MAIYYIPFNDAAFDAWFNNLVEYVLARVMTGTPVWTHIPVAETLDNVRTAWHTAYVPTLKPHTKVDTEAKMTRKRRR